MASIYLSAFLSTIVELHCYNSVPVLLYKCNGKLLLVPSHSPLSQTSNFIIQGKRLKKLFLMSAKYKRIYGVLTRKIMLFITSTYKPIFKGFNKNAAEVNLM